MYKYSALLMALLVCTSCSKVDDYFLGKDNTPKPADLQPIHGEVALQEKWSVSTGTESKSVPPFLKLNPKIIGNTVFLATPGGTLQAVDKIKGTVLWSRKFKDKIVSGPSVAQGYVAIATDVAKIILVQQKTGKTVWEAPVSQEVLATPVFAPNKLIAKTVDGNVYALDLATGKQQWKAEHGSPALILKASSSPVIIHNKIALVGYADGKIDALDLEDGHVIWQKNVAFANGASDVERLIDIDADPIVEGSTVLLGTYQGYVGALSLESGQFLWRKPASIYKNMLVRGNTLYFTDSKDVIWSINKQTGEVQWKQTALKARGVTEPVLLGNHLVFGDRTGWLHILSTKTGVCISRQGIGAAITVAPSVSNNNIYVLTAKGQLSRFTVV